MRILWVATKAPCPTTDGGRAVMLATIEALAASGARVTVVTPHANPHGNPLANEPLPIQRDRNDRTSDGNSTIVRFVQENPRYLRTDSYFLDWPNSMVRSFRSGRPVSVERHGHAPLAARVEALMRDEPPFDVVHAEQLQALPIAEPARRVGIPCVLRAQNVESAVWEASAGEAPAWRAAAMRLEARRMRRFEAEAIAGVDATIALSVDDAAALAALSPSASSRICAIPPPIPSSWLAGVGACGDGGSGDNGERSTFIWIGSAGWAPNDAARRWLLDDIWPAISTRIPEARLNVFAGEAARGVIGSHGAIVWRGAPRDSAEAFMPRGILLIPMRSASGIRMRLLEAWARGIPVIASRAAITGLDAQDGHDVLVADDARTFAEAAARLATDPQLRRSLVQAGRTTLARNHDPQRIAKATLDVYHQAIERHASTRPTNRWHL